MEPKVSCKVEINSSRNLKKIATNVLQSTLQRKRFAQAMLMVCFLTTALLFISIESCLMLTLLRKPIKMG